MFVIRDRALHSLESLPKIEMDFEKRTAPIMPHAVPTTTEIAVHQLI